MFSRYQCTMCCNYSGMSQLYWSLACSGDILLLALVSHIKNVQTYFFFPLFVRYRCESKVNDRKAAQKYVFQFNQNMSLRSAFLVTNIVPGFRTYARLSITSVPRVASTAV